LTEGGVDRAGIFHRLPWLDDARLAEIPVAKQRGRA
jgi:hypothetical protein